MLTLLPPLATVGGVARRLGVEIHQVQYVLMSRKISETTRVGKLRVFDDAGIGRIKTELAGIKSRPGCAPAFRMFVSG